MRVNKANQKLEHFALLVEKAAVCTIWIRLGILLTLNEELRMHHVM